jgi:hypothetical protein
VHYVGVCSFSKMVVYPTLTLECSIFFLNPNQSRNQLSLLKTLLSFT